MTDWHPLAQYVWHPYYVDALAVRYYDADTDNNLAEGADGTHYYLQDANYNVTTIVNADYIDYYNAIRRHSSLDYLSPTSFELAHKT